MKTKLLIVVLGLVLTAGAFSQNRLAGVNNPNAAAAAGQSEIMLNAEGADKDIAVWINGVIVAHLTPKSREKVIVYNGRNTVEAADTTLSRGQWNIGSKKRIEVDSNSNGVTVTLSTRYGSLLNPSISGTYALANQGGSAPPPSQAAAPPPGQSSSSSAAQSAAAAPAPASSGGVFSRLFGSGSSSSAPAPAAPTGGGNIEAALGRAAMVLFEKLTNGTTVAVLSIASSDKDMAEFVIDELTYFLVDANRYKVVDRRSLDAVRAEANFQYSGDVDDNSAVSIGKMLGASVVMTGSITGSGSTRRLRVKALNVQSAEILAMASEPF